MVSLQQTRVVLMDLMMPGTDAYRHARDTPKYPKVKVIA